MAYSILVGQGIGDALWSTFSCQDIARKHGNSKINLRVACWHTSKLETRAIDFLERFSFIDSVQMYKMPSVSNGPILKFGPSTDENGIYRYIASGPTTAYKGIDFVAIPNGHLERGLRLETWLPEYETNWNLMDSFQFEKSETQYADKFLRSLGRYVVFFLGCKNSNTVAGHNRHALWSPEEWVELGRKIHDKYGVKIVTVGAPYDASYFEEKIKPRIHSENYWHNCIGEWGIAQTYAVIRNARFVISYQSGIGIVSHYLNKPTAIFWRPKGNSISPNEYVSFEEDMAHAWAYPDWKERGNFMPCIYEKHGVDEIMDFTEKNNW